MTFFQWVVALFDSFVLDTSLFVLGFARMILVFLVVGIIAGIGWLLRWPINWLCDMIDAPRDWPSKRSL